MACSKKVVLAVDPGHGAGALVGHEAAAAVAQGQVVALRAALIPLPIIQMMATVIRLDPLPDIADLELFPTAQGQAVIQAAIVMDRDFFSPQ